MQNQTVERLSAYLEHVAELNDLPAGADPFIVAARTFNVAPSLQQTLIDRLTEDTSILGNFNVVLVPDQQGEKLGLGIDGKVIASRTNTSGGAKRQTIDPSNLDDDQYFCFQTNFDTHLRYAKLDLWAKFDDFEERIANHILNAQRRDRLRIGFNGRTAAADSDRDANPMGEDVNIGWLERLRLNAPARVMAEGAAAGKLTYGGDGSGDFKTLDALVYSLVNEAIDPWHRRRTDLVTLVGSDLLDDKYFNMVNTQQAPSEELASDQIMQVQRLGKRPAFMVPDFPANAVAVTTFDNLSIYEQEDKRRRAFRDMPDEDCYKNFESFNEAFVVEDYGLMAMAENIEEVA